jgi:hypothetical protein
VRQNYRIAIIVAACVVVVLITTLLVDLFNPNVASFSSSPYAPIIAALRGSDSPLAEYFVGSAEEDEGDTSSLASALFDDPTSEVPPDPSATPYIAAEGAPFSNIVGLAVEPTVLRTNSKPSATTTRGNGGSGTPASGGGSGGSGAPVSGGGDAPSGPTDVALGPDERGGSDGSSSPNRPGGSGGNRPPQGGTGVIDASPTSTSRPTATPVKTPTKTPVGAPEPSQTAKPTATSPIVITEPTSTPEPPTNTPVPPTNTPEPTDTPRPTRTPRPTSTPVPPTDTPVPPTDTPVPPTSTPVPPTDTPVPPTEQPTEPATAEPTQDSGSGGILCPIICVDL